MDASFNMLEASVGWRRQEDINKQVSHPLSAQKMLVIRKCRPSSYVGFDKLGRPVVRARDAPGLRFPPATSVVTCRPALSSFPSTWTAWGSWTSPPWRQRA